MESNYQESMQFWHPFVSVPVEEIFTKTVQQIFGGFSQSHSNGKLAKELTTNILSNGNCLQNFVWCMIRINWLLL